MMRYRLIATDLDGTALDPERRITARTKRDLEEALNRGIQVVIATGRTFSALPGDVRRIKGLRYVICSNGAEIRDLTDDSLIYSNYLSSQSVGKILETVRDEEVMLEVFTGGRAYTDEVNYERVSRGELTFRNREYILETRTPLPDLTAFALDHRDRIENINVNFADMAMKPHLRKLLERIEDTTLTTSFDHNWELGGASTSKGNALSRLCRMLGIRPRECMAAGDSPNDASMLSFAGLGIAVANAKEEILRAAEYVTGSNAEEGFAEAVEKFILTQEARGPKL